MISTSNAGYATDQLNVVIFIIAEYFLFNIRLNDKFICVN